MRAFEAYTHLRQLQSPIHIVGNIMSVVEYDASQLRTRAHNPILHHCPLLRYRSLVLPAAHSRSTFTHSNSSRVHAATQPRAAEWSRILTGGFIERGLRGLKTKTLRVLRCPETGAAQATTAGRIPAPSAAQIVPASLREPQQRRSRRASEWVLRLMLVYGVIIRWKEDNSDDNSVGHFVVAPIFKQ